MSLVPVVAGKGYPPSPPTECVEPGTTPPPGVIAGKGENAASWLDAKGEGSCLPAIEDSRCDFWDTRRRELRGDIGGEDGREWIGVAPGGVLDPGCGCRGEG